jgi:hypothetical protein
MREALFQTRSGHTLILIPSKFYSLHLSPCVAQSPPPYSPLPPGPSAKPSPPPNLPPELAPTNYVHVKERDSSVKQKILLDLSVPRPRASTLPVPQGDDTPHLILDSHNGAVHGEVWLLSANREDTASHEERKPARERVRLHFRSHNGAVKALVVRGLVWAKVQNPRRVLTVFVFVFVRAASSSADGRASPVPQHRSQGTQWLNHGRDSAILPRTADASYRQRPSAPLAFSCSSGRIAVFHQRDSHILRW